MSYILEALKKSEQERGLSVSDEKTESSIFSPHNSKASKGVSRITIVLILIVLAAIFSTVYLYKDSAGEGGLSPIKQPKAEGISRAVISTPVIKNTVVKSTIVKSAAITTQQVGVEKPIVEHDVLAKEQSAPIAIEMAPLELISQLSPIEITSHIFSSQSSRRSIVANGLRLKEGDLVEAGVKVHEITHQGMIIKIKNELLVVDRSRGWGR